MEKFLTIKWIDWIYEYWPSKEYRSLLMDKLDLHELIEEDLMESWTQDKIDVYDQCLFVVLNFPKFNTDRKKYINNEFNMILWKDYIVTLTKYKSNHIDKIKDEYKETLAALEKDEQYKISPYYILYRVIDEMLPHQEIIDQIQEETTKFYGWELDVYFEDLAYKIDKILSKVSIQSENIDSLYDVYNAMVSMKTNSIITVLTIFTAIIWMMTLITWFYGMNLTLPFAKNPETVFYLVSWMTVIGLWMLLFFRRKKRM